MSRIFNDLKERKMINITEEQLKEIVTQAHMAGQHNQTGCDPSYFEAETHWQKQVKNIAYEPVLADEAQRSELLSGFRYWYDHLSIEEDQMYEGRYEEVYLATL